MVYNFFLILASVWCVLAVKIQPITEPVVLGESPHWDERQQALYFISNGEVNRIHKYVLATGLQTKTKIEGTLGFIVPVEGTCDQFLVGVDRKFQVVRWDGAEDSPITVVKEVGQVDCDQPDNRINDGKADPRGRVFAGTIGAGTFPNYEQNKASLFRLVGSNITRVAGRITASNGPAWDLKEKAMYYTDSWERKIRRYDYDVTTGEISNLKYIFDYKKNNVTGYPDGMTIDTDGNLWVACVDGSSVINIDPRTGALLQRLAIPAALVTSVTFGGPNFNILFVTSANLFSRRPPNGAVFMVTGLGVKGLRNRKFKI